MTIRSSAWIAVVGALVFASARARADSCDGVDTVTYQTTVSNNTVTGYAEAEDTSALRAIPRFVKVRAMDLSSS